MLIKYLTSLSLKWQFSAATNNFLASALAVCKAKYGVAIPQSALSVILLSTASTNALVSAIVLYETVNAKMIQVLKNDLTPIVCVGETLEEYEAGTTKDVVKTQTVAAFKDVCPISLVDKKRTT